VSGAPNLPAGFTGTFTSRYVDTGELRLHAVTGGEGPPLLLVHGWPQTWYAWRMLMPALARDFSVVAVDQRGIGLSGKPQGGYDTATLANDLAALMDALGHPRFALYGTDVGMPIAYALAADHRDRIDRLAVSEAPLPGDISLTAAVPPSAAQRAALASGLQPAPQGERAARHRAGGHLLRRGVRRLGRDEQAARRHCQLLHRHPRLQP
jgi:Predicted hydrolases or acyltransferases (alpha/beta hydrolase superfamily)